MPEQSDKGGHTVAFSFGTSGIWLLMVLVSAIFIATGKPAPQDWLMLPFVIGAQLAWIPFTLIAAIAAVVVLYRCWTNEQHRHMRRLAWIALALGCLLPAIGFGALYLSLYIRHL